ncbi:hypothetical protein L7F22_013686 [Adiantum nelumboides]|nr:hypothetical protein [Adiantum nelumboides]
MEWNVQMDDADYDIDIQESSSTSSNEEEDDAHIHTQVEWEDAADNESMLIDVTQHISSRYFAFDRDAYSLTITSLQEDTTMSLHALKMIDHRGMLDLKKWRKIKEVLCLKEVENGSLCICLKADPSTRIACMEDWQDIVEGVHCMDGGSCHRDLANTLEALRSTWCIGVRHYEIPISFINDFVNSCGCIHQKKINVVTQCSLDLNKLPSYIISTLKSNLDFQLEQLMFEHKVRLVMVRSAKRRQSSTLVIDYICHRGGKPKRCGSEKKRIRTSKKCGCPFKVQVQSSDDKDEVTIHIYPNHDGHVPGTKSDLYHLPIHPSVVECCAQDLFDIGSSRHVAQMSVSKEKYHLERAAMLDQTIFRFFMIPKEVQMLSYKKRIEGRIPNDDWATMHIEVAALQKQQKVMFPHGNVDTTNLEADSGRFGLQGSSRKHTSKLREGEAILQRYMLDQSSLVIINESSLQFKIQSSSIPNQWYNVSLQANYCDCPDWSSECKHLYGIRLIATRYFQHLSDVLPVVDKAHEMMDTMGDDTCDDINQEQDAIECLQDIKKIVESLERGLSNRSSREMDIVMHQLKSARDTLGSLMSPEQIQLPMRASIRQVQAHVTQTRLGHGKWKVNVESLDERGIKEPITQPEKPTRQTGTFGENTNEVVVVFDLMSILVFFVLIVVPKPYW